MTLHSAKEHGHTFGEAFMLMWYACDCGHRERIWNSRDGVTPFALMCPSCAGEMGTLRHIAWQWDKYAPDHKPHPGQRFFRDGTPDEAQAIMQQHGLETMMGKAAPLATIFAPTTRVAYRMPATRHLICARCALESPVHVLQFLGEDDPEEDQT